MRMKSRLKVMAPIGNEYFGSIFSKGNGVLTIGSKAGAIVG